MGELILKLDVGTVIWALLQVKYYVTQFLKTELHDPSHFDLEDWSNISLKLNQTGQVFAYAGQHVGEDFDALHQIVDKIGSLIDGEESVAEGGSSIKSASDGKTDAMKSSESRA